MIILYVILIVITSLLQMVIGGLILDYIDKKQVGSFLFAVIFTIICIIVSCNILAWIRIIQNNINIFFTG